MLHQFSFILFSISFGIKDLFSCASEHVQMVFVTMCKKLCMFNKRFSCNTVDIFMDIRETESLVWCILRIYELVHNGKH